MNYRNAKVLRLLPALFFVFACGKTPSTPDGPPIHFAVTLRLPAAYRKSTPRYRALLSRASHLEIAFTNEGSTLATLHYPPDQWRQLPTAAVALPEKLPGGLTVEARFWDKTPDGQGRKRKVMVGHEKIAAKRIGPDKVIPVSIRLAALESDAE